MWLRGTRLPPHGAPRRAHSIVDGSDASRLPHRPEVPIAFSFGETPGRRESDKDTESTRAVVKEVVDETIAAEREAGPSEPSVGTRFSAKEIHENVRHAAEEEMDR